MNFFKSLFSSSIKSTKPVNPTLDSFKNNINLLLDFPWFKELYDNEDIQKIIEEDPEIRDMINKENIKSLKYYPRKQIKLRTKLTNAIYFKIK